MGATDSQIAMWRGAIALIWANASIDEAEKNQLLEYLKDNVYLTDEQRQQLITDLDHKIELKDVWGQITDPQDRAHLIDIAPSLFSKHGKPTTEEKALYDKMFADQMATVNTSKLEGELSVIKMHIPVEQAEIEREYEHDFDNCGAFGRMIYHFNKMLGDVP